MGLREAKKQKTRAAISQMATKLFIERGYDNVTTSEIAALAEVSVPTLFKYFPSKEALVFDEDADRELFLVNTVKNKKPSQSIGNALLEAGLAELDVILRIHRKDTNNFMKLLRETPALNHYAQQMWLRHAISLAAAIRSESKTKIGRAESEAIARYVLDAFHRSIGESNPKAALKAMMGILQQGWKG